MTTIPSSTNAAMTAYNFTVETKTSPSALRAAGEAVQLERSSEDSISLSRTSSEYSNSISGNAPFFPVRTGMNADALILAASKPEAVSSSKDKTFAEVAADARKRMDEKYAQMAASGKPYSNIDEDRNALMGDLDRRSLNAVATNEGGQFTTEEQASAQALMRQQARLASGYYSGPADQKHNWHDPFINDPYGRAIAALAFMDGMSPEEKAKPEWLSQHLSLEAALNQSVSTDPVEKKTGHFHNLAEILAGVDTDGSDDKDFSADKYVDPVLRFLKKYYRSPSDA